MKISTVSEMRNLDKTAIEKFGISEDLLMENAGCAAYQVLSQTVGVKDRRFVIFCGIGNNGGDGFVIARKIHADYGDVRIFILGDPEKYRGAAKRNLDIIRRLPIAVERIESQDAVNAVKSDICRCDAVVDAIFGTGLTRDVGGLYREIIELINQSGKKVLSLDIPSGVDGDTGQIKGVAVKADDTVTFGVPKIGNILFPGYAQCGKLYVTHISFPPTMYESLKIEINHPPQLPPRNPDGHKGDFGDVLFIAGARSYFGAPYFAAMAFMKAGGGYARLAAPQAITPFIAAKGSEIVFAPQQETASGSISLENKAELLELSEKTDMTVLGPGLSLDEETQTLVRELAMEIRKPLLIDGDGITAICQDLEIIKQRKAETILTPHIGEMARITQKSVSEIAADKINILRNTAKSLNAVIVLKGGHSLIGFPDERIFINMSGNSGMATAGSGDVLAGTVAAMFGLGLPLDDAARKGVFIHGVAGDIAAGDKGQDGITAQDMLEYLPVAVKADREGLNEGFQRMYAGTEMV
ncbi:MAG: bifunctional ADP-dependent (S)-NAD(P)H-hydrate dehydratase/NAD(P)H-hydrate epimerase [Desulfobacteraceae bacterium IS3]|nr:MAG: bifunctional ADP-dependent (S)-NAD(P)H-hydrate dehydratase/NAD(P)H-hydrate epimerase [Desulfobacteraceae bacterium IS3]